MDLAKNPAPDETQFALHQKEAIAHGQKRASGIQRRDGAARAC